MSDAPTRTERLAAHLPASERGRAAVGALAFGVSGGGVALCVAGGWAVLTRQNLLAPRQSSLELLGMVLWLSVSAGLGAAAVGGPLWWLLVERDDAPSGVRGAAVGATAGLFAHPLMWALFGAGVGTVALAEQGAGAVGSVDPGDVGSLLAAFALVSGVGVLLTGVVTVPVGAGTGVLLARVRRALPGGRERTPADL